ncbi:LytTR family DNA-binding domain-containing protein [Erythrobacter sp. WG]|uniref:LytTR family DNA-binding domain-containing protein n=1 Tax=Erythrobacter sp. WG TaxID=2985510 RepID=UPI00226DADB2|nr:LytTR family DNA-binding domain-containing protein [Erythrobacter sp. WG]MCX9145895.1 LytTR family transcriptional regulator [Erythrobacter sp. WG]
MNLPAFHASPNAHPLRARALRGLGIGLAAAVVLAVLGAMNTGQAAFGYRLLYWASVILPGSLLGIAVQTAVSAWGGLAGRRWIEILVVALLVSVPHTFMVIVATALFFGIGAITPGVVAFFGLTVLMVALVLTTINFLAASPEAEPPHAFGPEVPAAAQISAPEPEAAPATEPKLPVLPELIAEKLPVRLRQARLIAIEAEDHYLRVHTEAGSDLVLMRMTDACALLPEAAGARVHRSWWAARGAVEALARREGKAALTLQGGLTVPVSRAMLASLREQGWS